MNFSEIAKDYSVTKGNTIKRNIKFGRSPGLIGTTYEQIWDGGVVYTYLTATTALQISSSSASDTSTKTIRLMGLNANFDEISEDIALNGQTAVTSVLSYSRIYRAYLVSGASLVGDVYVSIASATLSAGVPTTASVIKAKILIGNNQTQMAMISVPRGYSMLITWAHLSSLGNNNADISVRIRPIGAESELDSNGFRVIYEFDQTGVNMQYDLNPPMVIREMYDFEVGAAFSSGTTNTISVSIGYYLVPNT